MSLPADIARQLQQLFREQAHQMRQIARDAVTQAFGGRMNGGKLDGDAVLAATSTGLGVVEPDNSTTTVDRFGVLSALAGLPIINQYVVTGSAVGSITFSPIRQDFEDLVFAIDGRVTGASNGYDWVTWQANGDTGANYDAADIVSVGGTANTANQNGITYGYAGTLADTSMDANVAGRVEGVILDYSGTAWHKATQCMYGSVGGSDTSAYVNGSGQSNWRNTNPITALKFAPENGNFAVGTVITLYGRGRGGVIGFTPVGLFNGTDNYVTAANTSVVPGSGDWSVGLWVKSTVIPPSTDFYLYWNDTLSVSNKPGIWLSINPAGAVRLHIRDASANEIDTNGGAIGGDSLWHHVTMTWVASTHTLSLYIDGALITSGTNASVGAVSPTGNVYLGAGIDGGSVVSQYFTGKLYDVRVYSVALSGVQVAALYSTDNSGTEGNCTGKWLFSDGTGTTVTDSSGNAHNGTYHGSVPYWSTK